jgi:hypothetical protein
MENPGAQINTISNELNTGSAWVVDKKTTAICELLEKKWPLVDLYIWVMYAPDTPHDNWHDKLLANEPQGVNQAFLELAEVAKNRDHPFHEGLFINGSWAYRTLQELFCSYHQIGRLKWVDFHNMINIALKALPSHLKFQLRVSAAMTVVALKNAWYREETDSFVLWWKEAWMLPALVTERFI